MDRNLAPLAAGLIQATLLLWTILLIAGASITTVVLGEAIVWALIVAGGLVLAKASHGTNA